MLSKPEVYRKLTARFVGVRFDWEQGNHYKEKFGFILGTGDQLLLDPQGNLIRHQDKKHKESRGVIFGRHGQDTTGEVLEEVVKDFPKRPGNLNLKMDWFFWPKKQSHRPGGSYPVSYESISGYARLPLAFVEGPMPEALEDPKFLQWHVRQFIWVRGKSTGPSQVRIERVKDGLKEELSPMLAKIDPSKLSKVELGKQLDQSWNDYMKDRPRTARGYLENPHGAWMRSVKDQMLEEENSIHELAKGGKLLPPGRQSSERRPY